MARVCKNWYLTFASLTSLSMGRLTKARCRWPFSEQISHDTIAIARDSCHLPSFPQCPTLGFGAKTPSLVANAMDGLLWYHHLAVVGRWFRTAELPMPMPRRKGSAQKTRKIAKLAQLSWNVGATSVKAWWNLPRNILAAQDRPCGSPRGICPREPETTKLGGNLGRTLVEPSAQPFGSPRQIQRTRESLKAILPRNLYYGWRPQSYRCWGKTRPTLDLKRMRSTTILNI